jgi:lipoic acid synthetase
MDATSLTLARKPEWLKKRLDPSAMAPVRALMRGQALHTVCEEAHCPNIAECWGRKTATFMILGDRCTRACAFCAVTTGRPIGLDTEEPARVAAAAAALGLRHVVVTSVNRDDLDDGGAAIFAGVVAALHAQGQSVEVLTPDFQGHASAIDRVATARPEIFGHNVETVPRLYHAMRPQADYRRSLDLLARVKEVRPELLTKSGLMVGVGETPEEVAGVMHDLRAVGCDVVTIGQYLAPGASYHPVVEYVTPQRFEEYRQAGDAMGFLAVASAPFVRSSYNADVVWERLRGAARQSAVRGAE